MIAAAIGAHLSAIGQGGGPGDERLAEASDAVREASFLLLKALHRGKGVKSSRLRALRSVDRLAVVLPGQSTRPASEPPPAPHPPTWLAAARLRLLGRLQPRRFETTVG